MAVIRPIQSQRTIDVGGVPNTRVDGSVGQGLQQLGSAIGQATNAQQDLELRRERMRMQTAEFRADQEFRRFGDAFALDYAKTQQDIDPSGEGFTEVVSKQFNAKADEFLRTVPESLRPKFSELVATQRESFINKAAAQEVDQRHTWFRQGISESQQKLAAQVFENPSQFNAALSDGERAIELSGLPRTEKEALKKQWKQTLLASKAENYIRTNPSLLTGSQSSSTGARLARAIITVESSGNPDAVSHAGASGLMQVMPGTAREIAEEIGDTQFPWVGNDATVREYLKRPDVSLRYGTHYFNKQLQRFGGDVEAALVAYNGGPERAEKWLNAGRDDSVLPKETQNYYKKVLAVYGREPRAAVQPRHIPITTGTQPGRQGADLAGVNPEVLSRFQEVQNIFGKQIPVVSGYRDPDRNRRAGGATNSRHIHGDALDLDVRGLSKEERLQLIQTASALGFTGVGVYGNSIHLDMGPRRAWGPSHKSDSIPGWAKGTIDQHLTGQANAPEGASGTVYLSPEFTDLPLTERIKLYDRGLAASEEMEQQQRATLKAQYDQHKGSLELGIETGDVSSELTILQDELLSDAHKADLLKAYRSKNEERIATADALAKFEAGALRVDPFDTKGKNTVDNVFKEMAKTSPVEDLQSTAEEIVRQTGVVPQAALNAIRGGLESQNIAEVAAAAQSAQRLASVDPAALSRRDGGKAVQDAADDFSYFVNRLNLSPEQAAQRLLDQRDPQKQRDRKALEPLVKDFIKERQDDDLGAIFDESFGGLASNPEIGFTPAQEAGIKAEYLAIAEDEFYRSGGDAEIAQNRAVERMKRLYGTTEVTGRKVLMKHPPERYWPAMVKSNINRSKSLHWAKQQLKRDLSEFSPDIDMDKVQLVTTPQTDAMVKRGEMPAYGVLYQDADGVWQTIPGKLWRPDPSAEKERAQIEQSAVEREAQRRMDRAIFRQGQQRINAQDRAAGRDRDTSLDNYLNGPVKPPAPARVTPPTQQEQLQEQRQQLQQGAQQRGLTPSQALSGNDPIFGAR